MSDLTLDAPRPLIDLLGARWMVGARATSLAWEAGGGLVGFGLSDGTLAVARRAWDGGPKLRPREGGGVELVPPGAPPPPVARIPVHDGPCVALAADPDGGFLSGGEDGQLARVQPDGVIETLARFGALPAAPLATGIGRWRVCAAGSTLLRLAPAARKIDLPDAIAALAVAPDGSRVAIGHARGISLWAGGERLRSFTLAGANVHADLAWSPDARWIASATRDGDVFLWHAADGAVRQIDQGRFARRSLAFTADGAWLATSGGGAVACWNLQRFELDPCGIGSKGMVLQVACHPARALVAVGYANGAIVICRPANADVVFARGPGGGGIDVLAWSPDGEALAFGASGGEAGLLVLPGQLFRDAAGAAP